MNAKAISEKDLLIAIKDLLKRNGHLNKISAEVNVKNLVCMYIIQFNSLVTYTGDEKQGPPQPTEEVLLINELVREYLEWNGYLYTASVMTSEAAMPKTKQTRAALCMEVGVKDDEKSSVLPLLSNIIAAYTERIRRKMNKSKKEVY
ncbi:hypothetical protein K1T71_005437 [Dendrolimus kikuchii]|uniref:Uncharacterized protein n=1 Tax=Dendrolimus kikuchii TaxID=765133 RepID=A0ACC1D555_9NEOP|nr:hypothetical protein K1T71_005437 [Dendrolimus kikuchii]